MVDAVNSQAGGVAAAHGGEGGHGHVGKLMDQLRQMSPDDQAKALDDLSQKRPGLADRLRKMLAQDGQDGTKAADGSTQADAGDGKVQHKGHHHGHHHHQAQAADGGSAQVAFADVPPPPPPQASEESASQPAEGPRDPALATALSAYSEQQQG